MQYHNFSTWGQHFYEDSLNHKMQNKKHKLLFCTNIEDVNSDYYIFILVYVHSINKITSIWTNLPFTPPHLSVGVWSLF